MARGGLGDSTRDVAARGGLADERPPEPAVHDGHDWIYVLSGRLRLVLGDEDFVLEPGGAAEFSCRVPRSLRAVGGPAEALAILGPHGERMHTR